MRPALRQERNIYVKRDFKIMRSSFRSEMDVIISPLKELHRAGRSSAFRRPPEGETPNSNYQITQRSFSGRTIGSPSLHWNAAANCGRFESGPLTRNFASGCGSELTKSRASSGRMLVAHPRA